jgi:hypothetical protein
MRNILEKARKRDYDEMKVGAQAIYLAESRVGAEAAFRAFRSRWRREYGSMVRRLQRDLPELLSYFAFPRHLGRKLRTTNVIERCFVEVRRRTGPMVCFVNVESVDRIIYSIFQRFKLGRKSLSSWITERNRNTRGFDPIAETTQFADHLRAATFSRPLAYGWTPFFVPHTLVKNYPDQTAKAMGNHSNGLIVSHARHQAAIHNFVDASFGLNRSIGSLVENAPHVPVAFWAAMAARYSRAFFVSGACANPGRELLG